MKKDKFYWLTICSLVLVILNIAYALHKSYPAVSNIDAIDVWALPLLSILIYLLLSYFIKNPHLLVKKTLADYENPEKASNAAAIEQWKKIYYYLRLAIILFITIVSFLS